MNSSTEKIDKSYYILIVVFSFILFYICILTRHTTDYGTHAASMETIPLRPLLNPFNWIEYFNEHGYPLWHMTGHLIMRILKCPADYAAGINSGGWCVLSYIGILRLLRYLLDDVSKKKISIFAFLLFLVAPVWLPWKNAFIVLHVGGMNVWHNATNICGRAVGIFAFYFSMKLLDKSVKSDYGYLPTIKQGAILSVLYVVSLLAKPSFAQTFAPAFGLLMLFYLIKSKGKFLRQFLAFMAMAILPGIRLFMQFLRYFGTESGEEGLYTQKSGEGIRFIVPTGDAIVDMLGKQILVVLFPMVMIVIMVLTKKGLDRYHAISWTMLLIGVICVLCLKGAATGEMGWAYYIAAFIVFTVGIRDYLKTFFSKERLQVNVRVESALFIISTVVLIEQFVTGLFYLYKLIICGKIIF